MTKGFVRTFGEGPEQVFALHCSLAHSGTWAGVAQKLAPHVTMQAMDLPGHRKSPAPERPEAMGDEATDWAKSILTQPTHLFGHSFGGYVALRLAVERPEMVLSLSLYEPVFFAAGEHWAPDLFATHIEEMRVLERHMREGNPEAAARGFVADWGAGLPWEAMPSDMRGAMIKGMPLVMGSTEALYEDKAGVLEKLSTLTIPVLLMDGAQSHAIVKPIQDCLADKISGARRVTLPKAGHMGAISHPKKVAEAFAQTMGL